MSSQADVRSLERVQQFLYELQKFRSELVKEIETLETELRRLTTWIERDANEYWAKEFARSQHAYSEAQQALSRCMSYVRAEERQPCTEQKKRVQVTKQRRELCETKLRTAKAAAMHWEREKIKLQTKIDHCRDLADAELLNAVNQLKAQLGRLEEYASLRSQGTRAFDSGSPSAARDQLATGDNSAAGGIAAIGNELNQADEGQSNA